MKDNTLEFKKREPKGESLTRRRVEYMVISSSIQTFDDDDVMIDDIREGSKMTREQLLALPQGPAYMIGQTINHAVNIVAQKTMEVLGRIFSVEELKLPPMPTGPQGMVAPHQINEGTVIKDNGPLN